MEKLQSLKEVLESFGNGIPQTVIENNTKAAGNVEEKLTEVFWTKLAPVFLYGGYIHVQTGNAADNAAPCGYRVYIRSVEFYFHAEEGSGIAVEDLIVYHRLKHSKYPYEVLADQVPYFPLMSLHAHQSGYDITFENEEKKYRASALIRTWDLYDEKQQKMIVGNDPRSSYLYYFLNGFSLEGQSSIRWVDEVADSIKGVTDIEGFSKENIQPDIRKNVYKYDKNRQKTGEKDDRPWRFTKAKNVKSLK